MHIVVAVHTPTVALFGPSNPDEWEPRGKRVTVLYKGLDCQACFHPICERDKDNSMNQLLLQEVCAAML